MGFFQTFKIPLLCVTRLCARSSFSLQQLQNHVQMFNKYSKFGIHFVPFGTNLAFVFNMFQ